MQKPIFSILITTKDRIYDLEITLNKIVYLLFNNQVECIIYDDGSEDGTYEFVKKNYPNIKLLRNKKSIGLIAGRNRLLKVTSAQYAVTLDDDANFVTVEPLEIIADYFKANPKCGVIAFRIFWGQLLPQKLDSKVSPLRVKSFVGCGHVWNMKAWREISDYPEWFRFYGEEDFAAFQLFKKGWEVHYVPKILVQHRVNVKSRKSHKDYRIRLRRSLRSGWYNYFLFLPWTKIPKRFFYTLYMQFKLKVLKGDLKATIAIFQALFDLIVHLPKLILESNRFSKKEFQEFENLENAKIYWNPQSKMNA